MITTITPQAFAELQQEHENLDLIDVRTPGEYQAIHVPCARNVPLNDVSASSVRGDCTYLICHSGSRAKQAADFLAATGCKNLVCIEGGTQAWDAAGLAVVRGRKVISLDRQVRIAAGSLVLLGVGLSLAVHPGWIGLSAFVGAGLVFAGITDTCGLAMALARLPWNR